MWYNVSEPASAAAEITITDRQYVERGETVVLQCNATGQTYPPDEMDWFRNGKRLMSKPDSGIDIQKQYSLSKRRFTSTLTIARASMEDDGIYICRASDLQITDTTVNVLNGAYNIVL